MNVSHTLLIRRDAMELRRVAKFLRRAQQGHAALPVMDVIHEMDKSCCKQEALNVTMTAIQQEVSRS